MATNFNIADLTSIGSTRTLLYTCPSGTQAVIFSGTVSNIDGSHLDQSLTIEALKVDGTTYIMVGNAIIVPFGSSLILPKIALLAGEKLYLTGSTAGSLTARASIVEKT